MLCVEYACVVQPTSFTLHTGIEHGTYGASAPTRHAEQGMLHTQAHNCTSVALLNIHYQNWHTTLCAHLLGHTARASAPCHRGHSGKQALPGWQS